MVVLMKVAGHEVMDIMMLQCARTSLLCSESVVVHMLSSVCIIMKLWI